MIISDEKAWDSYKNTHYHVEEHRQPNVMVACAQAHVAQAMAKSKDIKRVHSSQNKSHARSAILRMRNFPASTVKFLYKEIDGEIRIFVIKTAILTKLSR